MRELVKILVPGLALFVALAMAQEWQVFAAAWAGLARPGPPTLRAEDRRAAEDALRGFLSLTRHLYASGGDPRFGERLAASPDVLAEIEADVAFLRSIRRVQEPALLRADVLDARPLGEGRLELRTREYWIVRTLALPGRTEPEPPRSQVVGARYAMRLEGAAWRVEAWDLAPGAPGDPPPAAAPGERRP